MIAVCDMKPQYLEVCKEINKAIARVLMSGTYILGKEVRLFEKECASFIGVRHAVGVASGTDAITLAIRALSPKVDAEVILPANSYPSVWGVLNAGVKPVFCDIESTTLGIDESAIIKLINHRTCAVLVVHLYGVNMLTPNLQKYLRKKKIPIIEDCAQGFGGKRNGDFLGSLADISVFSFYPTKPLGGYGDGGMIMTKKERVYRKLLRLRMYGEKGRYQSVELGTNSRLDEVQAAILRLKLTKIKKWITARKQQAILYTKRLSLISGVSLIQSQWLNESAFHLYPILVDRRDQLRDFLLKHGVQTAIHYPLSLTQVKSLKEFLSEKKAPIAESTAKRLLSLPLYNGLTNEQQEKVINLIETFYSK